MLHKWDFAHGGWYKKGRAGGEVHELTTARHPVNVVAAIFVSIQSSSSPVAIYEDEHDTHILPSCTLMPHSSPKRRTVCADPMQNCNGSQWAAGVLFRATTSRNVCFLRRQM